MSDVNAAPPPSRPVIGISAGVFDRDRRRIDGIGVYTAALLAHLGNHGVEPKAVHAPRLGYWPAHRYDSREPHFGLPLEIALTASALVGVATPASGQVERSIDLYHATDYHVPRLRRIPVVATLHDAIPVMRPDWASQRLRGVKNWLLRRVVGHADAVIALSSAASAELVEHFRIPYERIRVVHPGVDEACFATMSRQDRERGLERLGLRPGYALLVGTLQPRKNVGCLLDAWERLPAAIRSERQLVIAGKYGWNSEDVRARLQRARAGGEVVWLDYVRRDDLLQLYASAHAFVFPSLAEGFGLPVLEAQAAGIPVIASDIPVLREVAGGHSRFVQAGDVDALASALEQAMRATSDPAMAATCRAWARTFSWSRCASATVAIYRELGAVA